LRQLEAELPASSTLADLLRGLELPSDAPGLLLVVNGRSADRSQALAEGDEVHLMPALSGG
jgi:sulfur carrier protein ThiS